MVGHGLTSVSIAFYFKGCRANIESDSRVRVHFSQASLEKTAINTVYSHVLNPMVASRSYMCIEPIELHLDVGALRRGLIMPVDPDTEPNALMVQDSGMVPVSTQISIVNPETNQLCLVGEYGEIWVQSEANAHSFYGSKERLDAERFNGRTIDGDPNVRYVRTGDLGFLHNVTRPIGPNGAPVDMQVLFVLGSIGDTFEVNGLNHFSMDIEQSVERCHRNIVPGGWYVNPHLKPHSQLTHPQRRVPSRRSRRRCCGNFPPQLPGLHGPCHRQRHPKRTPTCYRHRRLRHQRRLPPLASRREATRQDPRGLGNPQDAHHRPILDSRPQRPRKPNDDFRRTSWESEYEHEHARAWQHKRQHARSHRPTQLDAASTATTTIRPTTNAATKQLLPTPPPDRRNALRRYNTHRSASLFLTTWLRGDARGDGLLARRSRRPIQRL
jgi:hypothetical protein